MVSSLVFDEQTPGKLKTEGAVRFRRVVVFSERLAPPADEGIKNLTLSLAAGLRDTGREVCVLTSAGADWPEMAVRDLPADRLLRSPELHRAIRCFRPDAVLYVPTASLTLASALRARSLKAHAAGAPVALVATQGRRHKSVVRLATRLVRPDVCVVQSAATEKQAQRLGWRTFRTLPGVDLHRFRPVGVEERRRLRSELQLPVDRAIVLHVGHLNRRRGVIDLVSLSGMAHLLLVASTSTPQDESLARELRASGVQVINDYVPNITLFYQAADVYLFPTPPDPVAPSCIDVPLSVLEAAACDLPIVARRFGALGDMWPEKPGVMFYDRVDELPAVLAQAQRLPAVTRRLVEPSLPGQSSFGWSEMSSAILEKLMGS